MMFSHVGICVSDLDRAKAFYEGGLGFEEVDGLRLENTCGNVLGLDDFELEARFLVLGTTRIELLYFPRSVGSFRANELKQINHTGLTHLAFVVDDIAVAAERLVAAGGTAFPQTRGFRAASDKTVNFQYCSDPDFTRIELISYTYVS